jgi:hypothetical protein
MKNFLAFVCAVTLSVVGFIAFILIREGSQDYDLVDPDNEFGIGA